MNDFDYDAMRKKKLCASARKQKNGCKSRKCSLPSDHLTAAQLRAKNGPITSCNLNEPMDWEMFKALSADLQSEYIKGLNSRFSVGLTTIGRDLFGLSHQALPIYLQRHGNKLDVAGKRLSCEETLVWEHWLSRPHGKDEHEPVCEFEAAEVEEAEVEEPVEEAIPAEDSVAPAFGMKSLCAEWCGEFNALAFMAQLSRLPVPEGRVKIRLEVEQA